MLLLSIIVFSAGVSIGLKLNKEGTNVNKKWKGLKTWLRNIVRDNVK